MGGLGPDVAACSLALCLLTHLQPSVETDRCNPVKYASYMSEGGEEQSHYPFKSNQEYLERKSNLDWSSVFWQWLEEPEQFLTDREVTKKKDLPLPSPPFPPSDPKRLVESFNQYKRDLQEHKKYLQDLKEPGHERHRLATMKDIDDLSLHDVYLHGVQTITDRLTQRYTTTRPVKREDLPARIVAQVARHEQTLALVEDAMKLAGHQPKDVPLTKVP